VERGPTAGTTRSHRRPSLEQREQRPQQKQQQPFQHHKEHQLSSFHRSPVARDRGHRMRYRSRRKATTSRARTPLSFSRQHALSQISFELTHRAAFLRSAMERSSVRRSCRSAEKFCLGGVLRAALSQRPLSAAGGSREREGGAWGWVPLHSGVVGQGWKPDGPPRWHWAQNGSVVVDIASRMGAAEERGWDHRPSEKRCSAEREVTAGAIRFGRHKGNVG